MVRRLDKTLIDYLVIAISPALIMALVGSLVFFLLEVFYKGNYGGRLHVIFALFVFAAVLVARISIEEGHERAMLFALPLGIVTLLALNRFVQFQGALGPFSFFINCGLIGLVWWSSNKLTWDSTMIDESAEDSGEGLMEAVGLEKPGKAALQKEIAPADEVPNATAAREKKPLSWWARFLDRRRRPHAPGVWVVYFSLAALPLFGIGQFFISSADLPSRQYAFQLLFIYTASGLALLLTTSFLGLRRYLRQRRQEMPIAIVNLWLGIGGMLIVAVMLAAMLLPRPQAEYDVAELPFYVGSPDQNASPQGTGSEGVEENQSGVASEQSKEDSSDSATEKESEKTAASDSEAEKTAAEKNAAEKNEGTKKTSSKDSSKEKSKTENSSSKNNADEKSPSEKSPSDEKNEAASKTPSGYSSKEESEKTPRQQAKEAQRSFKISPPPRIPRLTSPAGIAWLLAWFKWIFYIVLAIFILVALWRNRQAIFAALSNLGAWLANFWENLFGGASRRRKAEAEAAGAKKTLPRFADFSDPFAAGVANRYPPAELVRYTFNALEAWARDHGYPRPADQTPHEFVRCLVLHVSALQDDAGRLADLYCQVAYAPFTLSPSNVAQLSQLWQKLRGENILDVSPGRQGSQAPSV